ncbi:MAG: metallophosphoesterase [Paraprevotella sp.]|nr:metallophosphoesterase [Paraprevotella sp.]
MKNYIRLTVLWLLAVLCPLQAQVMFVSSVAPKGTTWLRVDESNTTLCFTAAGGNLSIPVETNLDYRHEGGQDWCATACPDGRNTLYIKVDKNASASVRDARVVLEAKDNHRVVVHVSQLGSGPAILAKEKAVAISDDKVDFHIEVTSNVDLQVSVPEWITLLAEPAQGTVDYAFRAQKLTEEAASRTGEIVFSDKDGQAESVRVSVRQDFSGYPRFAVISDTHFGNHMGEGPMVKVRQALRNLISKTPRIDAIFICGDLTDWGNASQYEDFRKVFDDRTLVPEDLPVYVMMGNHDNYADKAQENYQVLSQPYHQLVDIKGYPFITTSMNGGGWNDYAPEEIEALEQNLEKAATEYPGKPIFVFTHVPPMNTVYGTCQGEGGWGSNILTASLSKYPQVVLFGGHSHFPLGDPRSIHQGVFTTINDGSTTYSEIEPGVVNEGIHPALYEYVTEGCIVNVDKDSNVEVERWDTYGNEEMLPRWYISAPHDGSRFVYTSERTGGTAPVWEAGSVATVADLEGESCTVTFPQAVDDENVHHYVIELLAEDNQVVARHSIFSGFYLNSRMPRTLTATLDGIPQGRTMRARVTALDSYKNESLPLGSEAFTTDEYTPAPGTEAPVADLFDICFSANGGAADRSPRATAVTAGPSLPATAFNEERGLWEASFTGSGSCFYRIDYENDSEIKEAFSNGFTFEVLYMPRTTGNMCPLSAQESGGAGIEQANGGGITFYCHVGGGYKALKSSVTARPDTYYHVVGVYDKAAQKTRIYVDGAPAGEMDAKGDFGFPGNVNARWIGIGGDCNGSGSGQFSLNGKVAVARMYAKAVSRDEVYWMYRAVNEGTVAP